uniref:Uncharacterized protein n=1 Tax=Setaria digitata TaxID=48799 RepID=A0A915PF79_9BILA
MDTESRSGIDVLSDANARVLFSALDAIEGPKIIAWDPSLIKQFNLVTTTEKLKKHKVVSMLQLELSLRVPQAEHNHVVYILSAYNSLIINKLIACLKHARSTNDRRVHHALFVPEASFMIRDTLKQNRDANSVLKTLESLPLRLFPLYCDFITLLMDDLPSKLLLDNDWTELQKCASAIRQLELLVSCLPNLRCKGKWAAQVVEIVKKMRTQDEAEAVLEHNDFRVSDIILMDRWVDPLTPLLLQLTYAGLVDEILDMGPTGNIKASKVRSANDCSDTANEISLHDPLFQMIRDLHIKDRLKENPPSDSLAESKVFVRRLLDMQGSEKHADIHTLIAGRLMSFIRDDLRYSTFPKLAFDIVRGEYGDRVIPQIENLILEAYNPIILMRFIALQCLVIGGFKNVTISTYERLFVQSYGGYYISLWIKMKLMGLLWEKNGKIKYEYAPFDFQTISHRMSCFVNEEHTTHGTTAYPYNGYIPLSVRYIEAGIRNNWRDWTTILSDSHPAIDHNTYSVVFIIGGITQAELACLRKTCFPNKLLVVSSAMITAKKVEELIADMTRQLIANAGSDEDVEVEVKMLFGKHIGSSKNETSQKESLGKDLCQMRRIPGSFDPTVTAAGISYDQSFTYLSPVQQATTDEDETSISGDTGEKRESAKKSASFDIVTFRGFVG